MATLPGLDFIGGPEPSSGPGRGNRGAASSSDSEPPLSRLDVLVIDCQATGAAPRGHLLEIGWGRAGLTTVAATSCLIKIPDGEHIPPAVARVTGITGRMLRGGVDASTAWRALAQDAAAFEQQPAPTVIHFARYEQPFLYRLAGGVPPLDIICTHEIARRLMADLPRRSLRALAGFFGRSVDTLRRSADHVEATAFVWHELMQLLDAEGVSTWSSLKAWLASPVVSPRPRRRTWPMSREVRLALPDAPGVYRMLRTSGDVLYVGKAGSLRDRVNSYFRHQRGIPERMLEMLSQARAISFAITPSTLEAALLEADEIKRLRPPYNIALTEGDRRVWFTAPDLLERSPRPSPRCPVGPFPSGDALEQFAALARGRRAALGQGRWAPESIVFCEGHARFRATHPELSMDHLAVAARLLRLGTRLWREGRRDRDADNEDSDGNDRRVAQWTPESVQLSLEWLAIRAAHARRRAMWLTRLTDVSIAWREPATTHSRLIIVENGDVTVRTESGEGAVLPIPPGHRRSNAARHEALTLARFDRLRVLSTELKRLASTGAPVAVRFGDRPPIAGARLASLLAWL